MLHEGSIWVGTGENGSVCLLPSMANRHGLIAGATGTGKTVSLKVLAEGFSDLGVPVFLSDIKSDLSGMVRPGVPTEAIGKRLVSCGIDPDTFDYHAYPSAFWDVYQEHGRPVLATVRDMGPLLLSRMLQLNETQTGIMSIVFRYTADTNIALNTLYDLKRVLAYMGEHSRDFTLEYGNVSVNSVGAIQRAVAMLEDQGGDVFFQAPAMNIQEWLKVDAETGRGVINILSADRLFNNPIMYSTFLLWMLTKLYEFLPERGDAEKPVVVFFFDEAHLLFDDCSRVLMDKIEQVVRLIRSKGVGVYFITQSPTDIPMPILGQLGNRIQHALRAYTPLDQKAVRVAAQTFRTNPSFDTEEAITTLKTGEALISFLDEHGAPGVVERATILPPQSFMGAVSDAERSGRNAAAPEVQPDASAMPAAAPEMPAEVSPETAAGHFTMPEPGMETPADFNQMTPEVPVVAVSSSTPQAVWENAAQNEMSQTFKVYDPATGQYTEQVLPQMTQPEAVPSVQQPVEQAAPAEQPAAPQTYVPAAEPVPTIQVQPAVPQTYAPAVQPVPTIQVPPVVQQMPVMVFDPTTGQYIQQMMTMQQDPATGSWIAVQPQAAAPQVPMDPIALAEQQKAAAKAAKEAEKAAAAAAKAAKEQEAAERRERLDALREEAAERARRNDSVAGRIKNTAISTATRQVTASLTKGLTNAISSLLGGKKR